MAVSRSVQGESPVVSETPMAQASGWSLVSARPVHNAEVREQVFAAWGRIWGDTSKHVSFPGPNPISIRAADLPTIAEYQLWVSEKLDGRRFLLHLLDIYDSRTGTLVPMALLVNRREEVYAFDVVADRVYFEGNGTVVDCECTLRTNGPAGAEAEAEDGPVRMDMWVMDIYCLANESLLQVVFGERYKTYHNMLLPPQEQVTWKDDMQTRHALAEKFTCVVSLNADVLIRPKPFFSPEHLPMIWAGRALRPHDVDGTIVMNDGVVERGRARTIWKWKEHHTLDLVMSLDLADPWRTMTLTYRTFARGRGTVVDILKDGIDLGGGGEVEGGNSGSGEEVAKRTTVVAAVAKTPFLESLVEEASKSHGAQGRPARLVALVECQVHCSHEVARHPMVVADAHEGSTAVGSGGVPLVLEPMCIRVDKGADESNVEFVVQQTILTVLEDITYERFSDALVGGRRKRREEELFL